MRIIKEYNIGERNIIVIVRSDTYASSYKHISNLVEVAKKYFNVSDEDIEVVKYGGDRYKRTYGVEFTVDLETEISADFQHISQVEYTL